MKIVALTDIHGAYARMTKIVANEEPDLVIIGGDLTTVGSVREAENALKEVRALVPALFCVAGNMDLPQHDELFQRLGISLNGRGENYSGIGFFGVSAAPVSRLHTPYELSEEELLKRIYEGYNAVSAAKKKIFVPHAPPYGTRVDIIHAGIHVGSTAVRDAIEDIQPDVVICGHIHESRGQDTLGRSTIVNCGSAKDGYYCTIEYAGGFKVYNKSG